MDNPNTTLKVALKASKQFSDIEEALICYHNANDEGLERYIIENNTRVKCKAGCTYCCNLSVSVQPYEIFLINSFITTSFSKTKKQDLLSALNDHKTRLSQLPKQEHLTLNITCPLLSGGCCMIYQVRPFSCRNYYSLDVSSCKRSFENPDDLNETRPFEPDLTYRLQGTRQTVLHIFDKLGYDTSQQELGTALLYSFLNPKNQKRWLHHKKVFVGLNTYR